MWAGWVGWLVCSFVWLWRVSAFDYVGVCLCYWIDTGCLCLSSWFFVFCPSMHVSVRVCVCVMVTGHGRGWWNFFVPPHWLESCRTSWYWLESEWWRWALRTVPLSSALQTLICHGAFDHLLIHNHKKRPLALFGGDRQFWSRRNDRIWLMLCNSTVNNFR